MNAKDNNGDMILHFAFQCYSHPEIVRGIISQLLNGGAKVNVFNDEGLSPLLEQIAYPDKLDFQVQRMELIHELIRYGSKTSSTFKKIISLDEVNPVHPVHPVHNRIDRIEGGDLF